MGECRFESPYDGYGGVFCKAHDGEVTPALCTHAAAALTAEVDKLREVARAAEELLGTPRDEIIEVDELGIVCSGLSVAEKQLRDALAIVKEVK